MASLVDNARAQQANPQFDGTEGRRPVGPGLWLAWDDEGDCPVIAPSGGVLVIAAGDSGDRIGVARDSVTGAYYAWDMDAGTPWIDADGKPVRLDAAVLKAHAAAGDGFSALDLAHVAAFETEVRALAEADEASLPGVVANLNALLTEMGESDHPLFDMADPYIRAVAQAIPLIAGAARWGRRTERGAARQILDQFLTLLHTGLDDPARLPEIRDPAREPRANDPTRVAADERDADEAKQALKEFGDEQSAEAPGDNAIEADNGVAPTQDATSPGASDVILLAQNDDAARPERDDRESGESSLPFGANQPMRDVEQGSALFLPESDIDSEVIAEQLVAQADPDDVVTADGIQVNRWKIGDGRVFVLSDEEAEGTGYRIGYAPERLDGFVLTRDLESGRVMAYQADETGQTLSFGVELSSDDYAEYAGNPLFDDDQVMGATAFAGYVRAYASLVLQEDVDPLQLYELGTVINQLRDQLAATNQMFGRGGTMNTRVFDAISDGMTPVWLPEWQLTWTTERRQAVADELLGLIEPDQMAHAAARGDASARYAEYLDTGEYPMPADTSLPPEDLSNSVTLRFDGTKLVWIEHGQVIESWPAVSGREGKQGPEFQQLVDEGPIPAGTYFVRQDQYQNIEDISVWQQLYGYAQQGEWSGSSTGWGDHRIELFPARGTETYGRTGMFLHGGAVPGSAGCVDLTSYLEAFIMKFHRLGRSVRLVVDYTGYEAARP